MGSSRKRKSVRAKSDRRGKRLPERELLPRVSSRGRTGISELSGGLIAEIENQRGVLVTVISLLHCLHLALEERRDHVEKERDRRVEAAVRWVSLPEMTAMLLERTHAVLSALDSMTLAKAVRP